MDKNELKLDLIQTEKSRSTTYTDYDYCNPSQIERDLQKGFLKKTKINLLVSYSPNHSLFGEDEFLDNKKRKVKPKVLCRLDHKNVEFNPGYFIKFFFIHLFYFNLLGPFISIFFLTNEKNKKLLINLRFLSFKGFIGFIQVLPFIGNVLIVINFFMSGIQENEIALLYSITLSSMLRCITIASKYSTYGKEKMEQIHSRAIHPIELGNDHMLGKWVHQPPDTVYRNLNRSIVKNEIEESNLYVTFMKAPNSSTNKKLQEAASIEEELDSSLSNNGFDKFENFKKRVEKADEICKMFKLVSERHNSITVCGDETCRFLDFYKGKTLLYFLYSRINDRNTNTYLKIFSYVYGFFRGYPPIIFCSSKIELLPGDSIFEKITFFCIAINQVLFFAYLSRFMLQAVLDFSRKITMMNCLEELISTERTSRKKYLPTLNLLDITTLNSWRKMRSIVKDYGRNMILRHEIAKPFFFLVMVFIIGFIYLNHWGVFSLSKEIQDTLCVIMYIDFIFLTMMIHVLLFTIARVNRFYRNHILKLLKLKSMLNELFVFREHYFGVKKTQYSIIKIEKEVIFGEKLVDPVVKAYAQMLKDIVPLEAIPGYLGELMSTVGSIIDDLEMELGYDQVTLLKVPVTLGFFINTLIGTLMSGVGALKFLFLTK